jgi:anti-sigma regulatory factor (Ser/Thr protein kinase)
VLWTLNFQATGLREAIVPRRLKSVVPATLRDDACGNVKEKDGGVDEEMAVIGTITLPGMELSVAHARRFAREVLGPDHPSLDDIELCVSEAFTNGVQHTASGCGGKVTVRLMAQAGAIVTEVTDDGAGGARPHLRRDPVGLGGRGMRIIDAVTLGWGLRSDGDRTTIWMRFPGPIPVSA